MSAVAQRTESIPGRIHQQRSWKRYVEIIIFRTWSDLKMDAARAYLGVLWWIVEPIAYIITFYIVFGVGLRNGGVAVVPFLTCGLIQFRLFSNIVITVSSSIQRNKGLMQQVYLPIFLCPLMSLTTSLARYFFTFAVMIFAIMAMGVFPSASWITLPILILILTTFSFAIGALVSVVYPFLPDIKLVVQSVTTMLFFGSGIHWDINSIPEPNQSLVRFNPIVGVLEEFRQVILDDMWPDWNFWGVMFVVSVLTLMLSFLMLRKLDHIYLKLPLS